MNKKLTKQRIYKSLVASNIRHSVLLLYTHSLAIRIKIYMYLIIKYTTIL